MAGLIRSITNTLGLTSPTPDLSGQTAKATEEANAQAGDIYKQAMDIAAREGAEGSVTPIVTADKIDVSTVDPGKYVVNPDAFTYVAPDGTYRTRGYTASEATAANYTGQLTPGQVTLAKNVTPIGTIDADTYVQAARIGDAAQTDLVDVGQTTVEGAKISGSADAARDESLAAARAIASAPSAAMSQFRAGQSQIVNDQLAMAEKARGAERAGARREAMIATGSQGTTANLAAAALAAKEEQDKRTAAAAALSGVRSQDTSLATTQAQLDAQKLQQQATINAQRNELQAQLNSAIAQGNTAAINAIKTQQAQLEQDARKATVAGNVTMAQTDADIQKANLAARQQTEITNAGAANQMEDTYRKAVADSTIKAADAATRVSEVNAAAADKAAADKASAENAAIAQATALEAKAKADAAASKQAVTTGNVERAATIDTGNAARETAAATQDTANTLAAQTGNADRAIAADKLQTDQETKALDTATSATGVQAGIGKAVADAGAKEAEIDQKENAAVIQGASTAGAAAVGKPSDERLKHDIYRIGGVSGGEVYGDGGRSDSEGDDIYAEAMKKPDEGPRLLADESDLEAIKNLSPEEVRQWATDVAPIVYRYNPGTEDGGANPHIGLGARALADSGPLGKATVYEDENGDLSADYIGAILMMSKAAIDTANEALATAKKGAR